MTRTVKDENGTFTLTKTDTRVNVSQWGYSVNRVVWVDWASGRAYAQIDGAFRCLEGGHCVRTLSDTVPAAYPAK